MPSGLELRSRSETFRLSVADNDRDKGGDECSELIALFANDIAKFTFRLSTSHSFIYSYCSPTVRGLAATANGAVITYYRVERLDKAGNSDY